MSVRTGNVFFTPPQIDYVKPSVQSQAGNGPCGGGSSAAVATLFKKYLTFVPLWCIYVCSDLMVLYYTDIRAQQDGMCRGW